MGGRPPGGPDGVEGDAPCATNYSPNAGLRVMRVYVRVSCVGSEAVVTRKYDQRKRFRHICYEDVLFNHSPHRTRRNFALQFIQPHCAGTPHLTRSGSPNNFSYSTMSSSSS